jgi:predicted ATPase
VCTFLRDLERAHHYIEEALPHASEQGFVIFASGCTIYRGWMRAIQGETLAGVEEIRQGLRVYQDTSAALFLPWFLAFLAEAYGLAGQPEAGLAGQPEAGLAVLTEALELVAKTGECFWEAELHRLHGALLLQHAMPDVPQAETCFHQALAVARQQQARSLELRAATSLARLWQQQGKRDVARELLAPIYWWFTEGFDTADLREACALLQELGDAGPGRG